MNHPIENRYRYGLVYNLDGQIVGFNLSPDVFVGLTDEEIEKALEAYAKRKYEQDDFLRTAGEIAKRINNFVGKTDEQNKGGE